MPLEEEPKLRVKFARRAEKEYFEWETSNPKIQIKILDLILKLKKISNQEKKKSSNTITGILEESQKKIDWCILFKMMS